MLKNNGFALPEHTIIRRGANHFKKQMRPRPATRAALLSWTFWLLSFALAKDHLATALRRMLCIDAHLKLAPQVWNSALLFLSEEEY
jgi:hypothetical protein